MSILAGDIKLVASAVMADVTEGGGAPTSHVIQDAVSNAIFPDISELDRAIGRVNLRKTFVHVQTANVDSYLGSNVIIAEPPSDPNVSVTIIQVDSFFSARADAKSRVEAYLAPGTAYAGHVFGDMLAGQRTISLAQKADIAIPNIGDTIILIKYQGTGNEYTQFCRVTAINASGLRVFTDDQGDFTRRIVVAAISDALRADFPGFDPRRIDYTTAERKARTGVFESVVADAARYYSAVPLAAAADMGDFVVHASGIHTKIVPSAQIETPIADARTNQISAALLPAGGVITQSLSLAFTTTQSLYVGGCILPGSLTVVRAGITITDAGGVLLQGSAQVGTVDYDNGILTLSTNVFGTGAGTQDVTYLPASSAQVVERSVGIPVTINNRSLSYVVTLYPPARRSLRVSYMVGGRWYVLYEDGSGKVAGSDIAFGVGTLNFTTGTLSLTLGALPDSGSAIILQWAEAPSDNVVAPTELKLGGKLFAPINTAGAISDTAGPKKIIPSTLSLTWSHSGTKTATDNGLGVLTGDATGLVDYGRGVIYFAPNVLPADDTVINIGVTAGVAHVATGLTWSGTAGTAKTTVLAPNLIPGSVTIPSYVVVRATVNGSPPGYQTAYAGGYVTVTDDASGNLIMAGLTVGTVNYTTGSVTVDGTLTTPAAVLAATGLLLKSGQYWLGADGIVYGPGRVGTPAELGITVTNVSPAEIYTSGVVGLDNVTYSLNAAASDPISVMLARLCLKPAYMAPGYTLQGAEFMLGGSRYVGTPAGTLVTAINPATGVGIPVGTVAASLGEVSLETWPAGTSNVVSQWRGHQAPPLSGTGDASSNISMIMRTATAPIRPSSFTLIGTMSDGTAINASADLAGKINHARVKGRINYETGVVECIFCNPSSTGIGTADLAYMGITGVTTVNLDTVLASTLRYNAVSYTYVPLDVSIIGVDPVRLPSDGRVPIIRAGSVVVIGNTQSVTATVSNAQVIDCARVRLSRVRVLGANGAVINAGYTTDLEAGTVTFTDVSGYSQPVTIEHRIEDMALVADAQINGELRLTRALTHDYPTTGTYVSSALLLGDTSTRTSNLFDQSTWDGITWSDTLSGSAATATYNATANPIVLTNQGTVTERWSLRFTNTTTFDIIGEHVGNIGTGTTGATCAPINPATNVPYFSVPATGWGSGWAVGNVLRFNTIGALFPVWLVRTIQQGPESVVNDTFTVLVRGDVDRP